MAIRDGCAMSVADKLAVYECLTGTMSGEEWAQLLAVPFEQAVCHRDAILLKSLLLSGASATWTALEMAVQSGHLDVISTLLRKGVNVRSVKPDGSTILHVAVGVDGLDTIAVQNILSAGADVNARNSKGETPLLVASGKSSSATVKALCRGGAEINQPDKCGWTPLHVAIFKSESICVAEALLDAGAAVHPRTRITNMSALDLAATRGDVGLIRALIWHGVNVNAADSKGRTSMHEAAENDRECVIYALIEAGASLDAQDSAGRTPLHTAAKYHAARAVVALLENGAPINEQDYRGQAPLHLAAANSRNDIGARVVDILLKRDADETMVDAKGRTPAQAVGREFIPETINVRLRQLLDNAPADRASRLKRFLVKYRVVPHRVQLRAVSGAAPAKDAKGRKLLKRAKIEKGPGNGGAGGAGAGVAGNAVAPIDTGSLMTAVAGMKEADLFRKILGFL